MRVNVNVHGDKDAGEKAAELKHKLETIMKNYGLEGSLKGEGSSFNGSYRTPKEKKKESEPKKYDPSQYKFDPSKYIEAGKKAKKEKKEKKVENVENVEKVE